MKLSTKLTTILALSAFGGWLAASPAWANPCTVSVTSLGGGNFEFTGTCPATHQERFTFYVDGHFVAEGNPVTEPIRAEGGPYPAGTSHIVKLACAEVMGWAPDECTANFTSMSGPTPTHGGATPTPPPSGPTPTPEVCYVNGNEGIPTGLGCIPTDPTGLVEKVLEIAIGVASGIALLLLISGAFRVLTSSGDPKAVMSGRETITSAIAGLLLILLSVAILRIIGIDILGLPLE